MAKFAIALLVAIAVHCTLAAPNEAPSENDGEPGHLAVIKLFKDIADEVQRHALDSKDSDENAAKAKVLANNLERILGKFKVQHDVLNMKLSDATYAVIGKLSRAFDDLQKFATPPEGTKAAEFKAKFDEHFKEFTLAGDKLKNEYKPFFERAHDRINAAGKFITEGLSSITGFGKHDGAPPRV